MTSPDVFTAVADPNRREILDLLTARPRSAGEIVSHFSQITQPGVSRHLRVLREAQLVDVTVRAQQRIYSLKPEGLQALHEWISKYQDFWTEKLDALEDHLQKDKILKRVAKRE